jgi:hypothetical protein
MKDSSVLPIVLTDYIGRGVRALQRIVCQRYLVDLVRSFDDRHDVCVPKPSGDREICAAPIGAVKMQGIGRSLAG